MYRRDFLSKLGVGGFLSAVSLPGFSFVKDPDNHKEYFPEKIIKPERLTEGDKIGLITPATYVTEEELATALENLELLGLKGTYSENMLVRKGYLGGTDAQRASDVNSMFADEDIAGIWCVRGGYGSSRLLPYLDYDLIRNNPKPLIGFSDITALHYGIFNKTGLVGFHGPVGKSEFTDFTKNSFQKILMGQSLPLDLENFSGERNEQPETPELYQTKVITHGKVSGNLVGGNLSLVSAMMGTPYDLEMEDKLVFLEEIGEDPYRIDRMLTQLLLSGKLEKASGIVLGIFKGCEMDEEDHSGNNFSLAYVLRDRLGALGIPVIYGYSFGHITNNLTIPMGIEAQLNTGPPILTLLEKPVR